MPPKIRSKPSDRRREPRRSASGQIKLRPETFAASAVRGEILDLTAGGFRARHTSQYLVSGLVVEFVFGKLVGRARIVWSRIVSGQVESGFLILPAGEN